MKAIKFYLFISIIFLSGKIYSQGTGNHITMYLKNCTLYAPNEIRFDLFVVSDGASTSDLRANSFQWGVNFNTAILPIGATFTMSYVASSSQMPQLNNSFSYPISSFPEHIRITQSPLTTNTGITLVVGQEYRWGTFRMVSSSPFVKNTSPDFSLQDASAGGKTVCAAVVWIGTTPSSTSIYEPGTGDGRRSVAVSCSLLITSVQDIFDNKNDQLKIFPNPIKNQFTIYNIPSGGSSLTTISIFDTIGKKIYTESLPVNRKEETINFNTVSGIYFVQLTNGEKQITRKLIVE